MVKRKESIQASISNNFNKLAEKAPPSLQNLGENIGETLKPALTTIKKDVFVYENQRWWIGKGFSSHLLMNGKIFFKRNSQILLFG